MTDVQQDAQGAHGYPEGQSTGVRRAAQVAKAASVAMAVLPAPVRDAALAAMADDLVAKTTTILAANARDVKKAQGEGVAAGLIDRLFLDEQRVAAMADGLRHLIALPDPIGEVVDGRTLVSGLHLTTVRVPLGVVAIIYEARPNVTVDAAGLCLKTGNACVLRGGSMAHESVIAIGQVLASSSEGVGVPTGWLQVIEDTTHGATDELMRLRGLVDVLIPRGGAGLIRACVEGATVPVIETGVGNCHIYLHEDADVDKAVRITVNAKCQRVGVCNAAESLLVDEAAAALLLPPVLSALGEQGVVLHCDPQALAIAHACAIPGVVAATDEDWGREYLGLEMSVACVSGVEAAIAHINRYGTGHSEAIVSESYGACERFLVGVDAAAVYANASTRFTDGEEFGLGAEIGISTQKLHVRGPMGLVALTTTKSMLRGVGQARA